MRTKLSSTSLRMMSDDDLRFLKRRQPGVTFGWVKKTLKNVYSSIKRMQEGTATDKDYKKLKLFYDKFELYKYAGLSYPDFWIAYQKKDYKRCLVILEDDISNTTKKTNKARMQWIIPVGVVSEMIRRGILSKSHS